MDRHDIECGLEPRYKMNRDKHKEDYFWKSRFAKEELFAIRKYLRDDELESLVFDLRYWTGNETVLDDGSIKRETGLVESASREVRFVKTHEFSRGFDKGPLEIEGNVVGYPNDETGIECKFICVYAVFNCQGTCQIGSLNSHYDGPILYYGSVFFFPGSGMIRWGSDPDRSHRSRVKRLKNWGWQIYNTKEVLRAIDPSPQQTSTDGSDNVENTTCNKCGGTCFGECIWKDCLDSLECIDLPIEPLAHGERVTVTAEVPTQLAEYIQGGDVGWWGDYVRVLHA